MSQISAEAINESVVRRWKRYPAYKDSDVEWLGEIPAHWEVSHLRRIVRSFVDYRGATPEKVPSGILLITAKNIKNGVINFSLSKEFIREEDYADWMVRGFPEVGDVLITTEAPLGESAQINSENIALAQRIILLKANKFRITNEYLKYHFASEAGKGELWSRATGSTAIGIKASHLKETLLTVPSVSEQIAIASFLDRETAKIDTLIAKKEQLIQLLQEKRTALISHAVTKGLNSDALMKDSGVEWLGEIPAHWEVSRVKFVSSIFVPQRNKPELNTDIGLPWITMDDITLPSVDCSIAGYCVSESDVLNAGSKALPPGCVIASCVGNLGIASINTVSVIINQQLQAYIPKRINPWFLRYFVNVSKAYFEKVATATTLVYVNQERFGEMPIVLPFFEEQEIILEFLDRETTKIDTLIAKIRTGVEHLKEYRTALISSAVTGKIDVREEADAA